MNPWIAFGFYTLGVSVDALLQWLLKKKQRASGVLRIDRSNPAKDCYQFVVNELDSLPEKKEILIKIEVVEKPARSLKKQGVL